MICPLAALALTECEKAYCQWWDNSINNCIIHRLAYIAASWEEVEAEMEAQLEEVLGYKKKIM